CPTRRSGRGTRACFSTWRGRARPAARTAGRSTCTREPRSRGTEGPCGARLLAEGPRVPRLLIVAPSWIGDALMAQPLLARLHEKIDGLEIDVLAPEWVAPVVRRMPEVREVIAAPFRHGALQLGLRWRLGRSLRARAYRQAIVLPNTWKSALVPFFADIPLRSGYVGESRYGLLNLIYKHRKDEVRDGKAE